MGVAKVPLNVIERAKFFPAKSKFEENKKKNIEFFDSNFVFNETNQINQIDKHMKKSKECLGMNAEDYRELLLKADTFFRMSHFETALLLYSQGIKLKFPYKNWFLDGYFRTTAVLYDLTTGDIPMFYGGNMNLFHRLVQGQERSKRIFNDSYKHYEELFPLEPNLTGVQEEINVFHVTKPEPPNHIQRRIWKAAMQQLTGARKFLGNFYEFKIQIEKILIKREHFLPRFERANQNERIEGALQCLRGQIEKFEVVCALMKSRKMRVKNDRPIDWMLKFGIWMSKNQNSMTHRRIKSSIPSAKTGGLLNSRYKWAFSQTLFDIREKPLDVCWIRRRGPNVKSNHLLGKRRSWKSICAHKSANRGALAVLQSGGQEWPFMQKLQRTVWDQLQQHAPPSGSLPIPDHILEIERQTEEYEQSKKVFGKTSKLVMPVTGNNDKGKVYYDPEINEQQWDDNRAIVKAALLKRGKVPSILPLPKDHRPIPANLLEIFETKASEDITAWDQRRKMSMELREILAKAEAVKAADAAQEKYALFGISKVTKKEPAVKAKSKKNSEVDVMDSDEVAVAETPAPEENAEKSEALSVNSLVSKNDEEKDEDLEPAKQERKIRRPGERPRFDILNKKPDREYLDKPCVKRRIPKLLMVDDFPPVEVVEIQSKTPGELAAENLLAAHTDDPVETARRIFNNQKAAILERSYAVLMTCTKISEFLEIELEIGDLLDTTFPPKNMRFPDGEPIILSGYPAPSADFTRMLPSEMFANRKQHKKKFGGTESGRAATAVEAAREVDAVQRLMAEKDRRQSVLAAASNAVLSTHKSSASSATDGEK